MITSEAAGYILQIANGIMKLTRRIDLVLAEKEATTAPIALPAPTLSLRPSALKMKSRLSALLGSPFDVNADPVGPDRQAIQEILENAPTSDQMFPYVQTYLPALARARVLDLNSAFAQELASARPDWAADTEVLTAAFYIGAGNDHRNKDYSWRIALTVVDVFAELGAQNAALLSSDKKTQGIVSKVLQRFADADLQKQDTNAGLLRSILAATLNGFLDVRGQVDINEKWLNGLIDAISTARSESDKPDNFVAGLIQGKGYSLLVSSVLKTTAGKLGADEASAFSKASADFLGRVASIIKEKPSFNEFFNDHWGDLLRAGLQSIEKHGPELLKDEDPILGKILSAIAGDLAKRPANKRLTSEALVGIVDAVVDTVAANLDVIDEILTDEWLATLVKSTVKTVSNTGIQEAYSQAGLEHMIKDAFKTFGERPELLINDAGMPQNLLSSILLSISEVSKINGETLASAVLSGSLQTVAKHPEIVSSDYPKLVADIAGRVAQLVSERKLSAIEGADLGRAVTQAMASNPKLLGDFKNKLVHLAIDAVMEASAAENLDSLRGDIRVRIIEEIVAALATSGKAALASHSIEQFPIELEKLLRAGFVRAEAEIGNRIELSSVPVVMKQLLVSWAQGKIASIDPENSNFKRLFAEIADFAAQNQPILK